MRLAQEKALELWKKGPTPLGRLSKTSIFDKTQAGSETFYSMNSTKMGMQTKWQKFGKFDPAKQIDNEIKREILRDYTFDEAQIDEFVDDPRLLALAQIKFMNQEDKEYATAEKEEEISEMVAYLLNQNVDTDQV